MAEIPLFPLRSVLFPGGRIPLRIFEQRYLEMVKDCMRNEVGFGIVMIRQGDEVLRSERQLPSIAQCGTYCRIVDFDQQDTGILQILVEGEVKFSVREQYESAAGLMLAQVEFLPLEEEDAVPQSKQHLAELLATLNAHDSVKALGVAINYQLACDVGARLTELLPAAFDFKQRMLEMKNPLLRLSELEKHLLRMQDFRG